MSLGYYEVLSDGSDHKVKRRVVATAGRLSLQNHKLRNELWFVVSGEGGAVIAYRDFPLRAGCVVDIPAGTKHREQNSFNINLIIIEIQTGEYFGEDNIQRFKDDYGRV